MGKPKILVVEDNTDIRRLYAIGLNQRGFEVKLAANGAEAVTRVEDERPDLILLDLFMPVMSGWDVLDKINPPESAAPVPIIIVSGAMTERPAPSCVRAWLAKPVTIDDLVRTINDQLGA